MTLKNLVAWYFFNQAVKAALVRRKIHTCLRQKIVQLIKNSIEILINIFFILFYDLLPSFW